MSVPAATLDTVVDPNRLAALATYGILNTAPEKGFDDIVLLARNICETPVALVSLVAGDQQWFKARLGFPECGTDLNASVCVHALVEPDLLVIPDLTRDPRTLTNPLVTGGPGIRFYAGAPLRTPDGKALGSLCVIDVAPRPSGLTPSQAESLRALAGQVMAQMDLRRALAEQRRLLGQSEELIRTQAALSGAKGDLGVMLDALVTGAIEAVPHAEGAVIETLDGEELVYRATTGVLVPHAGLRLPLRGSLAGACLLSGEPVLVPDVLEDARVKRDLVESLRLRSCVVVPVRRGREAVGVLKLQSSRRGAFTATDLKLAQVLAGTVSAGLAELGEGRRPARGRGPFAARTGGRRRGRVRRRARRCPARHARVLPPLRLATARQLPVYGLRAAGYPGGRAPRLDRDFPHERAGAARRRIPHPPTRHGGGALDRPQGRARTRRGRQAPPLRRRRATSPSSGPTGTRWPRASGSRRCCWSSATACATSPKWPR
jgi:GAF domain-containing protein